MSPHNCRWCSELQPAASVKQLMWGWGWLFRLRKSWHALPAGPYISRLNLTKDGSWERKSWSTQHIHTQAPASASSAHAQRHMHEYETNTDTAGAHAALCKWLWHFSPWGLTCYTSHYVAKCVCVFVWLKCEYYVIKELKVYLHNCKSSFYRI